MFRVIYVSNLNTGGSEVDRKDIVKAISEHFGVESKYLGAPSFAYEVNYPPLSTIGA